MNKHIQEAVENYINTAREHLEDMGSLCPVAFIFHEKKGEELPICEVVGMLWNGDEEKARASEFLQTRAKEPDVEAVFTILEAWMVKKGPEHQLSEWDLPPSMDVNRVECVVFQLSTREGTKVALTPMTEKDGKKSFGDVVFETDGKSEGIFAINLSSGVHTPES